MIAPDEITFAYLRQPLLPAQGNAWEKAESYWRSLSTDSGARFDTTVEIDAAAGLRS